MESGVPRCESIPAGKIAPASRCDPQGAGAESKSLDSYEMESIYEHWRTTAGPQTLLR